MNMWQIGLVSVGGGLFVSLTLFTVIVIREYRKATRAELRALNDEYKELCKEMA